MNTKQNTSKNLVVNPFKGKAGLVLRELLCSSSSTWTGDALSQQLGMGRQWCNRVLNTLESEHFVERGERGVGAYTKLLDPKGIIEQWLALYRWNRNKIYNYILKKDSPLQEIAHIARERNFQYIATGASALRTKYHEKIEGPDSVYVHPKQSGYKAEKNLRNLLERKYGFYRILEGTPDIQIIFPVLGNGVFHGASTHQGIECVSDLQLYLDLMSGHPLGGQVKKVCAELRKKCFLHIKEKQIPHSLP